MSRMALMVCSWMAMVSMVSAAPLYLPQQTEAHEDRDPRIAAPPTKASQDTIWIADWTFDSGGTCDDTGWTRIDNRIQADGIIPWQVNTTFHGTGNIVDDAAVVGRHDLCWVIPDGYGNNENSAIRMEYTGDTFLSFDFLVDSEGGFDFLQVETDSACASFSQVDYMIDPVRNAASFRDVLWMESGLHLNGSLDSLSLSGYGTAQTHCLYVTFLSDAAFSTCDGLQPPFLGVAAVIDNIAMVGGTTYSQDFAGGNTTGLTFVDLKDVEPFALPGSGGWTRLFAHITDNDLCTENTTCAWLDTDDTTPTLANDPSMSFAPGGYVIRNWWDDIVMTPWVSFSTTPGASGTSLTFRRFPGNFFSTSRVAQNWSVRGKTKVDNTDTPAPGDSVTCISEWGHAFQWNSLSFFGWLDHEFTMETSFDPTSTDIQVRFRQSDWRLIAGSSPPSTFNPGPGPFWDRVRIGRQVLTGPVLDEGIDNRSQGQDAFASDPFMTSGPATQESFLPRTTRFGTVALSRGGDIATNWDNLITGDSLTIDVEDVRNAGGITSIMFYGAIVEGPHAGKAPPPHAVAGDFFSFAADSSRASTGFILTDRYFIDFDDDYLLPGDVLHYFWLATDASGGVASDPTGLSSVPTTVEEAQLATSGLLEVSCLPRMNWDSDILAAAQTGPNGKIAQDDLDNPIPAWTDEFGAVAEQATCLLYYQHINSRRRSGDINRTTFMYTLDKLGYEQLYDVYDHQGYGNTNNHLGGRATVQQATGYALLAYDAGNRSPGTLIPDGSCIDSEKIDQAQWFRDYLSQGITSEAGIATLYIVSSNAVQDSQTYPLFTVDFGLSFVSGNQGLNVNPLVDGVAAMNYSNGNIADYSSDLFQVQGGCPTFRDYDALQATTGTETHTWKDPSFGTLGDAAMVQNANVAESWNTIMQPFPLFDMRGLAPTDDPVEELLSDILGAVLPPGCIASPNPTDTGDPDGSHQVPRLPSLGDAFPNPFNPMTTMRFVLSRAANTTLEIFDVRGSRVRTLVSGHLAAGPHQTTWDGTGDDGARVGSGIYWYRLQSGSFDESKRMVMVK